MVTKKGNAQEKISLYPRKFKIPNRKLLSKMIIKAIKEYKKKAKK